jgi:hypothetical protein
MPIGARLAARDRALCARGGGYEMSPTVRRSATAVSILVAAALLLGAAMVATHSVSHNGQSCGSVVKPSDVEAFGPPGTNVRPCAGTHNADLGITLLLLLGAVVIIVVLARSRPGPSEEPRVAEKTATP